MVIQTIIDKKKSGTIFLQGGEQSHKSKSLQKLQ